MECKDAEYMLAIARHQSISNAAKELYITQPALTRYLKNLEDRLSVELFTRSGKKLLPTAAGERYLFYANETDECIKKCMQELTEIRQSQHTRLAIAFSNNGAQRILRKAIAVLRTRYPDLQIDIAEYESNTIDQKLLHNEIDLGFISLPTPCGEMEFETLLEEYVLIAMPVARPIAAAGERVEGCPYEWIDIRKFKDQPFIQQNEGRRFRREIDRIFKQHDIKPHVVMNVANRATALGFAQQGLGWCLTTEAFVRDLAHPEKLRFFVIGEPLEKMSAGVVYRKGENLRPYAQELIRIFKEVSQLPDSPVD